MTSLLQNIDYEIFIKFGVTAFLGMMIGLEREIKRKPLGLKTCLVISIVSCLLTIVSIRTSYTFNQTDFKVKITMDPLRLAAQIVSGVGFIGAGVILKKENDTILGLTTAAIIWEAAGIGIGVGAGYYFETAFAVLIILLCVKLVPFTLRRIGPKPLREREVNLKLIVSENENIETIIEEIRSKKFTINSVDISDLDQGKQEIKINLGVHFKTPVTKIYYFANSIHGVQKVNVESHC